jgi:uncharacterized membrane protein
MKTMTTTTPCSSNHRVKTVVVEHLAFSLFIVSFFFITLSNNLNSNLTFFGTQISGK